MRSDMRKGNANCIQFDLAQVLVLDVRRRSNQLLLFNANRAQ